MGIFVPGISFFNLKDSFISPTKLISFFEKFEVFNNMHPLGEAPMAQTIFLFFFKLATNFLILIL